MALRVCRLSSPSASSWQRCSSSCWASSRSWRAWPRCRCRTRCIRAVAPSVLLPGHGPGAADPEAASLTSPWSHKAEVELERAGTKPTKVALDNRLMRLSATAAFCRRARQWLNRYALAGGEVVPLRSPCKIALFWGLSDATYGVGDAPALQGREPHISHARHKLTGRRACRSTAKRLGSAKSSPTQRQQGQQRSPQAPSKTHQFSCIVCRSFKARIPSHHCTT